MTRTSGTRTRGTGRSLETVLVHVHEARVRKPAVADRRQPSVEADACVHAFAGPCVRFPDGLLRLVEVVDEHHMSRADCGRGARAAVLCEDAVRVRIVGVSDSGHS